MKLIIIILFMLISSCQQLPYGTGFIGVKVDFPEYKKAKENISRELYTKDSNSESSTDLLIVIKFCIRIILIFETPLITIE